MKMYVDLSGKATEAVALPLLYSVYTEISYIFKKMFDRSIFILDLHFFKNLQKNLRNVL